MSTPRDSLRGNMDDEMEMRTNLYARKSEGMSMHFNVIK